MDDLRIAYVSSVDYAKGAVRVYFNDRDKAVSNWLPFLDAEYSMPEVDDQVVVALFPNSAGSRGVVLGRLYTDKHKPTQGAKGVYRKELSRTAGKCYLRYMESTGTLDIHCDGRINIDGASIHLND